jgi:hypothetical protein
MRGAAILRRRHKRAVQRRKQGVGRLDPPAPGRRARVQSYRRAERNLMFGDEDRRRRYRLLRGLIEGLASELYVEHVIPPSVTSGTGIVDHDQSIDVSSALLMFRSVAA